MTDIYRISIPKKDKIFADWMSAQINPSLSMRLLIRHFIDENGVEDVFNAFGMELVTKGRGRPRKADVVYKVPTEPVVEVSAVSAHGESVGKPEIVVKNDDNVSDVISEMDKMKGLMNG